MIYRDQTIFVPPKGCVLEQISLERQRRLYELNRLARIGRVTLGLIHDISNPLLFSTVLLKQNENKNKKLILRGLYEISDLITATREQFINQPCKKYFYPSTEIKRAIVFLKFALKKQNVTCNLILESGLRIYGNSSKFYQCCSNLISNALEAYSTCNSGNMNRTINIYLKKEQDIIEFSVQDFGVGISRKHQKYIFQALFTTKSPICGTGIGLAETKNIIENLFNGSISFTSKQNFGTTFTIKMPLPCLPSPPTLH